MNSVQSKTVDKWMISSIKKLIKSIVYGFVYNIKLKMRIKSS